uniref:DUF4136 domain-containing protein n=1 Tax=Phenylobacterium glaciei TaxID=2803784 RepID=A0A974S6Z5_9CAUL|nr:hypothetical protein JKL49_16680 [Phenylobacterium glaciei]
MVRLVAALGAICLLAGCAIQPPTIDVSVSGFVAAEFSPTLQHAVVPFDAEQANDLQFAEASEEVQRALVKAGLQVATSAERPDVGVFVDYGIGSPRTETSVVSLPIWGQTGVASSTTTGYLSPTGAISAVTTNTPSYGVVGADSVPVSTTVYDRYVMLSGFDLNRYAKSKEVKRFWQIKITSSGSSGDLRLIIPYMLNAAVPYLGKSTGKAVTVVLSQDDANAEYLRTG